MTGQTREDQLPRLSNPTTNVNDANYLVNKYLFRDLETAIRKYGAGEVLDLGCGNKPYQRFFADRATRYLGVDVAQSSAKAVDIVCLATHVPLKNATRDTILSTQVIEHVADHRELMAEAFRILRPGGHLILSGPMFWEHHEVPYDFFRFTRYGLEHLLNAAGFVTLEVIPNGGKWAMVGQMLQNSWISSIYWGKTTPRRILKVAFAVLRVKWAINLVFAALDRWDYDPGATLNFIVVARKPAATERSSR